MNVRNIKLEISYDGTNFHGFQIQPDQRTIQGELQKAIGMIIKQQIKITASGRTDTGVHARKQVCNFHTESRIPVEKWVDALNSLLPEDIVVKSATEMPFEFHSRFDVKKKIYRYSIYNDRVVDVFRRNYTWHYPYSLDIETMKKASQLFIGEHDFTSFSSAKSEIENRTRTIYEAEIGKIGNEIYFQISGNGFLYNMVRIIMGTLVEVGSGKMSLEDIRSLFREKNRSMAGITAPAKGLTLWDVEY
ncbi:tRNA pseudouridine(38-40) synthase TruA [Vulcanibacillus modesticaldus]|uniref:tRNA pseudouridine synthase A n=1 Tax=Vulcanibacillus modesticaldus TaxID=337097 RepID=A0A1D2YS55_9BACI|nr:tRNA pseudouridine(38-40) synthase TruA [Vulcanibacillus modesticaldus]OEF96450.1 tRNA pseudouridine(38-40) synthase TruA [Vulcanibacillus modesticaldus]